MSKDVIETEEEAYEQGFFAGTQALADGNYCAKTCMDAVNGFRLEGKLREQFIQGWKDSY
jgi:hypothetical protein